MASKRRNMFQKNKTQETMDNAQRPTFRNIELNNSVVQYQILNDKFVEVIMEKDNAHPPEMEVDMSSLTRNKTSTSLGHNRSTSTSPMELVFSWSEASSLAEDSGCSSGMKRKCPPVQDDSGYVTTTPCSPPLRHIEYEDTPASHQQPKSVKQLTFDTLPPVSLMSSYHQPDSFLEFVSETSLYTEPMEVVATEPPTTNRGNMDSVAWTTTHGPSPKKASISHTCRSPLASPEVSKQITPDMADWRTSVSSSLHRLGFYSPKKAAHFGRRYCGSVGSTGLSSGSSSSSWRRRPRSLCGMETVDMLYQLAVVKNQSLVVSKILGYLSDEDISNATMVSKIWKNICLIDQRTKGRWINYVADRRQRKENLRVEAKNLKSGEVLMQCPHCSLPSTCSPSLQLGQCKRISCQATFCTVCMRQYHEPGTPCPGTETSLMDTPPKRQRSGSSASVAARNKKRFLRRL
ncbi:hypothetical protein AAG570_002289 [Ranatra chinensis]|uniref:ZBR-type domain-containing protein n=1 Tax=Ranatra chinensis TaxID=642074 RepID=A0ABD0YL89_9HEMI